MHHMISQTIVLINSLFINFVPSNHLLISHLFSFTIDSHTQPWDGNLFGLYNGFTIHTINLSLQPYHKASHRYLFLNHIIASYKATLQPYNDTNQTFNLVRHFFSQGFSQLPIIKVIRFVIMKHLRAICKWFHTMRLFYLLKVLYLTCLILDNGWNQTVDLVVSNFYQ